MAERHTTMGEREKEEREEDNDGGAQKLRNQKKGKKGKRKGITVRRERDTQKEVGRTASGQKGVQERTRKIGNTKTYTHTERKEESKKKERKRNKQTQVTMSSFGTLFASHVP